MHHWPTFGALYCISTPTNHPLKKQKNSHHPSPTLCSHTISTPKSPLMSTGSETINNDNGNSNSMAFCYFRKSWFDQLQNYQRQLLSALRNNQHRENEEKLKEVIAIVIEHYTLYYGWKLRAIQEDAFLMLAPPWLSSFERSSLWIAGFRPGLVFKLVLKATRDEDLTEEQRQMMDLLQAETKAEQEKLSQEMAKIQESIVGPDFVRASTERHVDDVEWRQLEATLKAMKETLKGIIKNADYLRATTVTEILKILSPVQSVRFLATSAQFQLKIRSWGAQMDASRGTTTTTRT